MDLASRQPGAAPGQGRGRGAVGGGFRPGGGGPRGAGLLRMLPVMTVLDADQDGEISAKEIENAVAALKGLDKNKDGKLRK